MHFSKSAFSVLNRFTFKTRSLTIIFFWYLALFPGRLGSDYSLAIRMIQRGESTNWWTGIYFWMLRFSTFYGRSIALISLLGLLTLAYSLWYFLSSIITQRNILEKTFTITLLTPLYGVFGATISHDVFQTSGILIFLGVLWKLFQSRFLDKSVFYNFAFGSLLLITTQTGIYTVAFCSGLIAMKKYRRQAIIIFISVLSVSQLSNIGVGPSIIKHPSSNILLADLKCVVQHPDAELNNEDWQVLESIAKRELWLSPLSCSSPDAIIAKLEVSDTGVPLSRNLIRAYLRILSGHPAIVMQAHLQRSLGALPPPFFQGPSNQVDRNIDNPVGLGTNTALQLGPEILHPSIDEPGVATKIRILKPLEVVAQVPTFLFNQASWFWGWGGFWLWPIFGYYIYVLKVRRFIALLSALSPILILHLSYVAVGPGPLGRYYFSTILAGFALTISIFLISLCKES